MGAGELNAGARVKEREALWAELMRAANAGDAAAYQRLLKGLAPALRAATRRGLARARMSDADTEDVVQEALLAIHLKRHTWDAGRPIGPWIRAIVRNKLIDNLRRRGGRINLPIEDFEEFLSADTPKPALELSDVEPYVGGLPYRQRQVVQAILREEISIRETAERLKMTEGAVRVALHRGLAGLAKRFKRGEP
jgi:RNA polymerase sigma-70 factor (ECF subfamily)